MPDAEVGNDPIIFGDFSAYRIVDRQALSILSDPYTQARKGVTRIHATRRTGGRVLGFDFDAAGNLIAADAIQGLLSVSPQGKITLLTRSVNGDPIRYADAVVVADMPMLAETDQPRAGLDLVLVVEAPAEVRVERLVNVRGMTREEAWERMDAQPSDAEHREIADAVIVNDAGREALTKAVRKFWDERVQPVLDEHAGGGED